MIIVDTNILVPLFVPHENTAKCQRLFTLDPDWNFADWWQVECANVLRNLHRSARITPGDACRAIGQALRLIPPANTHPVNLEQALLIACESNITAYDARFIALARSFGNKLVTEDIRLRASCPEDTRSLDEALALLS